MDLVIDPVCGMQFTANVAAGHSEYLNRTFYFCHPVCKKIFDTRPLRFVYGEKAKRQARPTKSMPAAVGSGIAQGTLDVSHSSTCF